MRWENYVLFLFSLSVVFYFFGYTSPLMKTLSNQGCTDAKIAEAKANGTELNCVVDAASLLKAIAQNITSDKSLEDLLLISVVGFAALLLTGFGTIYLIPLIMLLTLLNYVVFPISFIADPALPDFVKYPLVVFFNLLTVFAISSYVRGG